MLTRRLFLRSAGVLSGGKSLAEVQADKPSAEFDETWGKGFMPTANFLALVFNTTR